MGAHERLLRIVVLGAVALVAAAMPARAQVSPGPLAAVHEALDRPTLCFQCHSKRLQRAPLDAQCLSCHREVGWMRARQRGLHARVADTPCAKCHPDHGGREFDLIAWEEGAAEKFDHRRAGWLLEGEHAGLECRACHKPALMKSGAVPLMPRGDRARRWMGLERECASCHQDPHRGEVGTTCERCHDQKAWAPATRFDHARSRYPLTGAHRDVKCLQCHATPALVTGHDERGQPIPRWKPVPFQECSSCHRDPHANRFGPACARCHTTRAWKAIDARGFEHDRTRYPLRGAHARVECATCHDPVRAWGQKPAFARCGDCHRDAHGGTATLAGKAVDCAACHDVTAFDRATFTVAAHARTKYPLAGAHARAECSLCHSQAAPNTARAAAFGTSRVDLRPGFAECVACHADPHRGRFRPGGARGRGQDCVACHTVERFAPSSFGLAAHADGRYPLEGAHRAVPCQACHAELKAPAPGSTLRAVAQALPALAFEVARQGCADCHAGPHGDQFGQRRDGGDCRACHGLEAFAPASAFDHDRDATFKLQGAHAKTACASCHRTERDAKGRARVIYRPLSGACTSCHATGSGSQTGSSSPHATPAEGGDPMAARLMMTTREGHHGARH
jgi:hypothetical protein